MYTQKFMVFGSATLTAQKAVDSPPLAKNFHNPLVVQQIPWCVLLRSFWQCLASLSVRFALPLRRTCGENLRKLSTTARTAARHTATPTLQSPFRLLPLVGQLLTVLLDGTIRKLRCSG